MKIRHFGVSVWLLPSLFACNTVTMNSVNVNSISILENSAESEHFKIYFSEENGQTIEILLHTLEDNYKRIISVLKIEPSTKSNVYIYPNLNSFHMAINMPYAADWVVGVFQDNAIKIVSPNNPGPQHNYNSIIKVIVHEFVHLVANKINNIVPNYLSEGLALILAEQEQEGVNIIISSAIKNNNFPSIETLSTLSGEDGLYQYGYAFVKYILFEYDYEDLLRLYKNPNIQEVFNISNDEFIENWIRYLTNIYSV